MTPEAARHIARESARLHLLQAREDLARAQEWTAGVAAQHAHHNTPATAWRLECAQEREADVAALVELLEREAEEVGVTEDTLPIAEQTALEAAREHGSVAVNATVGAWIVEAMGESAHIERCGALQIARAIWEGGEVSVSTYKGACVVAYDAGVTR